MCSHGCFYDLHSTRIGQAGACGDGVRSKQSDLRTAAVKGAGIITIVLNISNEPFTLAHDPLARLTLVTDLQREIYKCGSLIFHSSICHARLGLANTKEGLRQLSPSHGLHMNTCGSTFPNHQSCFVHPIVETLDYSRRVSVITQHQLFRSRYTVQASQIADSQG